MSNKWEKMAYLSLAVTKPGFLMVDDNQSATGWSSLLPETASFSSPAVIGAEEEYNGQSRNTKTCEVVCYSTSAQDSDGREGARGLTLFGLNENFNEVVVTVGLRGTEHVSTGIKLIRCYRVVVSDAGSVGGPVGTITICQQADSEDPDFEPIQYVTVDPWESIGGLCAFTVPTGKSAIIKNRQFSFLNSDGNIFTVMIDLVARQYGSPVFVMLDRSIFDRDRCPSDLGFINILLPEKTDVIVRIPKVIGAVGVAARIDYILFDD